MLELAMAAARAVKVGLKLASETWTIERVTEAATKQ
jgi:hypothetical protein